MVAGLASPAPGSLPLIFLPASSQVCTIPAVRSQQCCGPSAPTPLGLFCWASHWLCIRHPGRPARWAVPTRPTSRSPSGRREPPRGTSSQDLSLSVRISVAGSPGSLNLGTVGRFRLDDLCGGAVLCTVVGCLAASPAHCVHGIPPSRDGSQRPQTVPVLPGESPQLRTVLNGWLSPGSLSIHL